MLCKTAFRASGIPGLLNDRLQEIISSNQLKVVPKVFIPEKARTSLDNQERFDDLTEKYNTLKKGKKIIHKNEAAIDFNFRLAGLLVEGKSRKEIQKLIPGAPKHIEAGVVLDQIEKILALPTEVKPIDPVYAKKVLEKELGDSDEDLKQFASDIIEKMYEDSLAPGSDPTPRKTNVFFGGSPGTGKTRYVQVIAEAAGRPYFEITAGGKDPKTVFAEIDEFLKSSGDKMAFVFVDEASDVMNPPKVAQMDAKAKAPKGARTPMTTEFLPVLEGNQTLLRSPSLSLGTGPSSNVYHDSSRLVFWFAGNDDLEDEALNDRIRSVWFGKIPLPSRRKLQNLSF